MKCVKCGYESKDNVEKQKFILCKICHAFCPNDELLFKKYIDDKINSDSLESFRKYGVFSGEKQKTGMLKKAISGKIMSRAPFGYQIEKGKLIPSTNYKEIEEIFESFLSDNLSLRQLAKKHNLSVNGLKKILRNFTYIGKVKFNNEIHESTHMPLLSLTLFNHVQNKLENLKIK